MASRVIEDQVRVDARAEDQARQYVAAQNVYVTNYTSPAPTPAAAWRTLPRDLAAFTGRDTELRRINAAAAGVAKVVCIYTVDGMAGVGKTVLVIHAAHLLEKRFPDGQLFVPLHAYTPGHRPKDPGDVLADLLACTGMTPDQIPADTEARMERWRARLAGKKVLLVLDDAANHAQIEPLLPGAPGCLVLITSRHRMILDGAKPLPLDTLPPGKASKLFARLSGRTLAGSETDKVGELVKLCGYLPLAIALLAGQLANHPNWSITTFAAGFADAKDDRLAELAADDDDPAVAAAFNMSYQDLSAHLQHVFRRLGLHPGPEIDAYATAALADVLLGQVRHDLNDLYMDHLIDESDYRRYRLHDLIRTYTRKLAADDPIDDRDQAIERLLNYYQRTAETVNSHLARLICPRASTGVSYDAAIPDVATPARALAWMHTERPNLLACIEHAAHNGQDARVVHLTAAMAGFLRQEGPWTEAATLHRTAASCAHRLSDRLGEASALKELGQVRYQTGDYPEATDFLGQALALYRDHGDRLGEADTLWELGSVHFHTGDYPGTADVLGQALALYRDHGDRLGEANALTDLGSVHLQTGDHPEAMKLLGQALALYRDLGRRLGEANALWELGQVHIYTGDYREAADVLGQALALYRGLRERHGEANALKELGQVRYHTGDYRGAADLLGQALAIERDLGARLGEAHTLKELGRVRYQTADYRGAADVLGQALALFHDHGERLGEAETHNYMGALLAHSARLRAACASYWQALNLAREVNSPLQQARALEGIARCQASLGEPDAALDHLRHAVAIYQSIGVPAAVAASALLSAWEADGVHAAASHDQYANAPEAAVG